MHQDTKYDIRECERKPQRIQGFVRDLTQNWEWAEQAIAVADRFFKFDHSEVRFSGYVTGDCNDEPLRVEVWNGTSLAYDVKFERAGVEGIVFADMNDISEGLGEDMLGAMKKAVNEVRGLPAGCPRFMSVKVFELDVVVNMDLRP